MPTTFALGKKTLLFILGLLAIFMAPASAQERGIDVIGKIRNPMPAFMVRVAVDHRNRVYRGGEEFVVKVRSEKAGFLYLLYLSADGKLKCLFPNMYQSDNHIPADTDILVPGPNADFSLQVGPPFGKEILKAVVMPTRVAPEQLGVKSLTKEVATELDEEGIKDVFVRPKRDSWVWSEHQVEITTVGDDQTALPAGPRRFGLFIGISKYRDKKNVRQLYASHRDAQQMAELMERTGKLDEQILLVNEQATLEQIEEAIRSLVAKSRPGDTVFIVWSGHGHRMADVTGQHQGSYTRFLVPYDGVYENLATVRRTMVIDRTFNRWLQDLDGRKLILIFDTCYSGGIGYGEKGLDDPTPDAPFDFLDDMMGRTKGMGQQEIAKLASATMDQVARERSQGDLSIMTFYLVELLKTRSAPVSLQDAFGYVEKKVPEYMRDHFPNVKQTPVLIDNTSPPVYLKP